MSISIHKKTQFSSRCPGRSRRVGISRGTVRHHVPGSVTLRDQDEKVSTGNPSGLPGFTAEHFQNVCAQGKRSARTSELPAWIVTPSQAFSRPPQSVRTFHGSGRAGSAGGLNASESRLTALPGLFMTLGTPGICAQAPDGGCRIGDSQPGEGRRQLMSGLTGKKPAAAPRLTRRDLPPEESYGSGSR